jgi:hypothetical protein
MELFPPRPRPRLTWTQLSVTCLALFALNLVLAIWMAYDAEALRRSEMTSPVVVHDMRPVTMRADHRPRAAQPEARSALVENLRHIVVILAMNAVILAALGYAVLARYLEALRRYNLGLPTGFDEQRLKRRYLRPQSLAAGRGMFDDFDRGEPPASRFEWPD